MRINPLGLGNHNNLYALAKKNGIRVKLVLFFDTGHGYIFNVKKRKPNTEVNWNNFYQELSKVVEDMDFELKTPMKGFTKINFNSSGGFRNYLKQKYNLNGL